MNNQPATAAELSLSVDMLRETASELAVRLRASADLTEAGRPVESALEDALSAYTGARAALRDVLEAAGTRWTVDGDFTDLDRIVAELAAAEEDARTREARIAELRTRHGMYADLLGQEEDEIARAHLTQLRDRIAEQLGELVGERPADADPALPGRHRRAPPHLAAHPAPAVPDAARDGRRHDPQSPS
ncbi:hypothetical protein [Kitasatospora sp. RG8]|uniref:hypothetical protein n=1 Tax=Kitasatospora sp. RG8 TaxID=2820815 RepID=UPI0027DD9337|nr:hypothetical protein [Kitasatospora sp. RG8]